MELTRRDALAALVAAGVGSVAGCSALVAPSDGEGTTERSDEGRSVDEDDVETLVALAEVVYPSSVSGVAAFVETYTAGRLDGDDAYGEGVAEAVDTLDEYTREFHGERYAALPATTRREVLDYMSVDVVDPDPEGRPSQRVRHYLVNELLYAFYTSPTGAELAGLENPPGHPGGTESYREGPSR